MDLDLLYVGMEGFDAASSYDLLLLLLFLRLRRHLGLLLCSIVGDGFSDDVKNRSLQHTLPTNSKKGESIASGQRCTTDHYAYPTCLNLILHEA